MQRCKEREKTSTKSLSGKLDQPSEERNWFSKNCTKLRQTWRSNIGKRKIRIWLLMRLIKSLNPNDFQPLQANRWADQAQRDEISLYEELELRNRLSVHQERNPMTVSQLLTQFQELQSKVIPWQTQESFTILNQRAALERPTFLITNFYDSEFQDFATQRFWIAAKYTELNGSDGKRF